MCTSNTARQPHGVRAARGPHAARVFGLPALAIAASLVAAGCSTTPLIPYSAETPPLALVPATQAGVQDKRARFREIYCAVLQARGNEVPDDRPCEEALSRVGSEPAGTGRPVDLGSSKRGLVAAIVAGIGYECFKAWLQTPGTTASHVRRFGYDMVQLEVDALSSSTSNARQIRDADHGHAHRHRGTAPRAGRLFQRRARHTRGGGGVPRNPPPRRGGGERCRLGRRIGAGQRCGAIPGRPAAPLSRERPAAQAMAAASTACGRAHARHGLRRTRCPGTCATTRSSRFRSRNGFRPS